MSSASSGVLRKVIVGLRQNDGSNISAKFVDCLVQYFGDNQLWAKVKFKLKNNVLILYGSQDKLHDHANSVDSSGNLQKILVQTYLCEESEKNPEATQDNRRSNLQALQHQIEEEFVFIQHSPECPLAQLSDDEAKSLPTEIYDRGIDVAVAVVVESSDHRILLTRRASHMRTFPGVWVPPGGHIDWDETMVEAGFRELKEETGLEFHPTEMTMRVLCLWESVYPVLLGLGNPKRHHVVVYLHVLVQKAWKEVQQFMKLDPTEVQSCTWLSAEIVKKLLYGRGNLGKHTMFTLKGQDELVEEELDITTMYHRSLWGRDSVYSGSQLALKKWAELVDTRENLASKI